MTRLLLAAVIVALAPLAGCGGGDDHAHGPDTHTHDAPPAAPATPSTTYLDTTGVAPDTTGFFDAAEAEAAHQAGGRHTHADGTTHEH
jgi:hypothetical protein